MPRFTLRAVLLGSLTLGLAAGGCSSSITLECEPGETYACTGDDGCIGVRACLPSGEDYTACNCGRDAGGPRLDAGPRDAGLTVVDGGPADAGQSDAGQSDAAPGDAGPPSLDAAADGGEPLVVGDGGFITTDGGGLAYVFPPRDFVCPAVSIPPCDTTQPARNNAERTVMLPRDRTPTTMTFLINVLSVSDASAGAGTVSLDVDGRYTMGASSGTCEDRAADYTSPLDPLQVGVDNAFAALVPIVEGFLDTDFCGGPTAGCLDRLVQENVDAGTILVMIQLDDVDSLTYDDSVEVRVFTVNATTALSYDSSGRLSAGQTFGTASTLASGLGDIFEGRLDVAFSSIVVPTGLFVPLNLNRVELRADISETALQNGVIAGSQPTSTLISIAPSGTAGLVMGLLDSLADVSPTATPTVCAELSTALTFDTVTATRL